MSVVDISVPLGLLAAVFLGSGGVLQKRGLDELPDLSADWWFKNGSIQWGEIKEVIVTLLNVYFLVGLGAAGLGGLLYMTALSMGDITIVQPLQAFGNFMAVTLGVLWLSEELEKIEYFGVALVILGVILLNIVA